MSESVVPREAFQRRPALLSAVDGEDLSHDGFCLREHAPLDLLIADRYRVEGFLGEGGTAEVFLARDLEEQRLLVVKRMKRDVASSRELRDRFLLEARALSCVNHASVVRVLDLGAPPDELPYLALEALRGESLGDYLRRQEVMSFHVLLPLMIEAARALAAVHAAGMVHRDVKPDNLFLVGPIGDPESIKVLDFGMARLSEEAHDEESTSILGTAQYMAPEQILVEPVDGRTDIYALGVVLFRALTGHLPFESQKKNDLLRHQLFSPVPPVTWLDESLPFLVERIIHKATRKAPSARFSNMDALADALEAVLGPQDPWAKSRLSTLVLAQAPDVYPPVTERGRKAAQILAAEFGIYSRPHETVPPEALVACVKS